MIAIPNVQPFSVGKAPTGEVRHEHASNGIAIAAQPFPHHQWPEMSPYWPTGETPKTKQNKKQQETNQKTTNKIRGRTVGRDEIYTWHQQSQPGVEPLYGKMDADKAELNGSKAAACKDLVPSAFPARATTLKIRSGLTMPCLESRALAPSGSMLTKISNKNTRRGKRTAITNVITTPNH